MLSDLDDKVLEDALRSYFVEQTRGLELGREVVPGLVGRGRFRQRARYIAAAAVIIAAVGGTLALSHERGSSDIIRLASYTFHLPSRFHTTSSAPHSCMPLATVDAPFSGSSAQIIEHPYNSPQVASAITSAGGCITIAMTNPYMPTADAPDPFRVSLSTPITVAGHVAWIESGQQGTGDALDLGVQVPYGNGQYQDLVVGTVGLPSNEVVRLVARGLQSLRRS